MLGHCIVATLHGSWNRTTPPREQTNRKAASTTGLEKSCTTSTNQSSNEDNCRHHKEALTNKNNTKEYINHAAPFCPGTNKLYQASPSWPAD